MNIYKKDDTNAFDQKFLRIELENPSNLKILKAEFRCGKILKIFTDPKFPLDVDLTNEETDQLSYSNTCYLAVYDEFGRKRTCEGSFSFPAKGAVV